MCSLPDTFSLQTKTHSTNTKTTHTITSNKNTEKPEPCAYFTLGVNGNEIPWWMSADVFDTNSHFPICCLIEHDEWWESGRRRDRWQHLGSIAWPIDSPSLLLLQPSWLLCPLTHTHSHTHASTHTIACTCTGIHTHNYGKGKKGRERVFHQLRQCLLFILPESFNCWTLE